MSSESWWTGRWCVINIASTDAMFIHSFWIFLLRLFKSTTTQRRSRHSTDTVSEFHAKAPQATVSDGLVQGPYVGARAGFESKTLGRQLLTVPMSHHVPPMLLNTWPEKLVQGMMMYCWFDFNCVYAHVHWQKCKLPATTPTLFKSAEFWIQIF